jgi:hypothetical protein
MTAHDLTLTVLRRQMAARALVDQNIHNLARSIFKAGIKVQFRVNMRMYFGVVQEVIGVPGRTQVRVENMMTGKKRDLQLADITGLVQEQ